MYEFLLVLAVLLFFALKYRETFVVKYGNPVNNEDLISFDPNAKGRRLFGLTPNTCEPNEELQAGMCYTRCEDGYNGNVTICSAETTRVAWSGTIPKKKGCSDYSNEGWKRCRDDGTSLWEDFQCSTDWRWPPKTECNGCGCIKKNLFDRQYCDDNQDLIDALCYPKCPTGMRHVPGIPGLCFKGNRGLTYDRGIGRAPPIFKFGE